MDLPYTFQVSGQVQRLEGEGLSFQCGKYILAYAWGLDPKSCGREIGSEESDSVQQIPFFSAVQRKVWGIGWAQAQVKGFNPVQTLAFNQHSDLHWHTCTCQDIKLCGSVKWVFPFDERKTGVEVKQQVGMLRLWLVMHRASCSSDLLLYWGVCAEQSKGAVPVLHPAQESCFTCLATNDCCGH